MSTDVFPVAFNAMRPEGLVITGPEIARGGFGVVYPGLDASDERVAVKALLPEHTGNPKVVEAFLGEGELLGQFDHPNVIGLRGLGTIDQGPYFAMEFADGGSVASEIKERGQYPETEESADYAIQAALGLAALHGEIGDHPGITHRDIKPGNVLIMLAKLAGAGGKTIKIGDPGIWVPGHSDLTATAAIPTQNAIGSFPFMAPEQFRGKARKSSDQRALAIMAYLMVSGGEYPIMPEDRTNAFEWFMAHTTQAVRPLKKRTPDGGIDHVADELNGPLLIALSADYGGRYPTTSAFRDALLQAVETGRKKQARNPKTTGLDGTTQPPTRPSTLPYTRTLPTESIRREPQPGTLPYPKPEATRPYPKNETPRPKTNPKKENAKV